jgi:hypothetical protein
VAEVQAQAYEYVVEGTGQFPWDMLRHDRAWPKSSTEIVNLAPHHRSSFLNDKRQVRLMGINEPMEARWRSFGWTVIEFDRTSLTVNTMRKARVR